MDLDAKWADLETGQPLRKQEGPFFCSPIGDNRVSKREQADYLPPVAKGAGIVVAALTFLLAISPFLAGFAYWIKP